jgi:mannose-6-phosphate isomerase-like protein (cupin superfamily)
MRGGSHELRAGSDDTAGAMSFWLSSTQLGKGPPLHIHEREDELLYVVSGRYLLDCGGVAVEGGAGTLVYLPRKTAHIFRSISEDGPSRLVHCCVPGGIEGYFDAIGDSEAASDEGRELRRAAGARFGMSFPSERAARLDGADREPRLFLAETAEPPRPGPREARAHPLLEAARCDGRLALDDLHFEPGAAWRFAATDSWRVLHLFSGELELRAEDGACDPVATGCTAILPPGWRGGLAHRGRSGARAFLFAAAAPLTPARA